MHNSFKIVFIIGLSLGQLAFNDCMEDQERAFLVRDQIGNPLWSNNYEKEKEKGGDEQKESYARDTHVTQEMLDKALFSAIQERDLNKLVKLINLGANVNVQVRCIALAGDSDESILPIHFAAIRGYQEIIKCLLEHGADINARAGENRYQAIHQAAGNGHVVLVEWLIGRGAHINAQDGDRNQPLHYAAQNGYSAMVKWLVKHGADIKAKNKQEVEPVLLAARKNHLDLAGWLLNHGAADAELEVASNNKEKITRSITTEEIPEKLMKATEAGNLGMVKALVDCGADLKCFKIYHSESRNQYDFLWPLHVAAQQGYKPIVKYLIQQGADVNVPVGSGQLCGYTPLHFAAEYGHEAIVEYLVKKGANIRASSQITLGLSESLIAVLPIHLRGSFGIQPIHTAAWGCQQKIIELLVKYGADIHAQDENGNQPMHCILTKYYSEMLAQQSGDQRYDTDIVKDRALIQWFVLHGVSADIKNKRGEQPIHHAAVGGDLDLLKWLVEHGADIRAQTGNLSLNPLKSVLHCAAENGHLDIVQYLVGQGFDIDEWSGANETVLCVALKSGKLTLVKWLIENGANLDKLDNSQSTALHIAASRAHLDLAKWLIANGANVNAESKPGWTPLHGAVIGGKAESALKLVELLLLNGADVNARVKQGTDKGKRPIDLVKKKEKRRAIFNLLKSSDKTKPKDKSKDRCLLS